MVYGIVCRSLLLIHGVWIGVDQWCFSIWISVDLCFYPCFYPCIHLRADESVMTRVCVQVFAYNFYTKRCETEEAEDTLQQCLEQWRQLRDDMEDGQFDVQVCVGGCPPPTPPPPSPS